jgi:hypothetical protein
MKHCKETTVPTILIQNGELSQRYHIFADEINIFTLITASLTESTSTGYHLIMKTVKYTGW